MEVTIYQHDDGTFAVYTAHGIDPISDDFATRDEAQEWIDRHPQLWQ